MSSLAGGEPKPSGCRADANIPYTPPSSRLDSPSEHRFRQQVERAVLGGRYDDALQLIGPRLASGRFVDTALHLLGVVRLYQGDSDSAEDCLERALALRSGAPDAERCVSTHNALARVAMHREEYDRAWEELDRALALDPVALHLHWNRLCLARNHFACSGSPDPQLVERLRSARQGMANVDPEWREESEASPFLLSLK